MKKSWIFLVLVMILLFAFPLLVACSSNNDIPANGNEEDPVNEDRPVELEFTLKADDTYEVSGHNNEGNMAIIPEEYNGKPVTSIGARAIGVNSEVNRHFSVVKSVTIPNTITSIGERAFSECELESLTIPDSVTSVGDFALICRGLKNLKIGKGLTELGEHAIGSSSTLESIIVDSENPKYSSNGNCFIDIENKTLLVGCKSSTIPNDGSVTKIGVLAFSNCKQLTSITIPNTITEIGGDAFVQAGLTSITIPNSVERIGDGAFGQCEDLTSVSIGSGTTFINSYAFYNSKKIANITIDSGNTVYSSSGNCIIKTATKELLIAFNSSTIPDDGTVTKINEYAFACCDKITKIVVPSSIHEISNGLFRNCELLEEIELPGVTQIGNNAFANLKNLRSVSISSDIAFVSDTAFNGCDSLQYYEHENAYYLGNADNNYLVLYKAKSTSITSCTINSNVKIIVDKAFMNCSSLSSIVIPSVITRITESAFENCTSLERVTLPSSITIIETRAFYGCSSLVRIDYNGTRSMYYNNILKGQNYATGVNADCKVYCTDHPSGTALVA